MSDDYTITTAVLRGQSADAHGRAFRVLRADGSRVFAKGHLSPDGEVIVRGGVVPAEAMAELRAMAMQTAATEPAPPSDPPPAVDPFEVAMAEARAAKTKGDLQRWARKRGLEVDEDEQTRPEMEAAIAAQLEAGAED